MEDFYVKVEFDLESEKWMWSIICKSSEIEYYTGFAYDAEAAFSQAMAQFDEMEEVI